ncbi:hypothetical protein TSUD_367840 [Trifolium subterraneum]|uniref:DUF4283 domain-containing protein n=1 Tax=Trifolium subterraneum TaxID=3900 RepID=A0A2Z6LM90_TRISU|nr:hypothetical protein TSUD_367840 [Trifolium subterraneum]
MEPDQPFDRFSLLILLLLFFVFDSVFGVKQRVVWHFRVRARLARFDRKDTKETTKLREEKNNAKMKRKGETSSGKGLHGEVRMKAETFIAMQETMAEGGKDTHVGTRKSDGTGESDTSEGVRVGDVRINLVGASRGGIRLCRARLCQGSLDTLVRYSCNAWNEDFFKICILDCGSYLRADSHTVDKIRFDYARILIATPLLEVIKSATKLLVDGEVVEIKILEEWGYAMGEGACLLEEGKTPEVSHSDNEEEHIDLEANNNVDVLFENLEVHQPNFSNKENDMAKRISQRTNNLEWDPQLPPLAHCTVINNESVSQTMFVKLLTRGHIPIRTLIKENVLTRARLGISAVWFRDRGAGNGCMITILGMQRAMEDVRGIGRVIGVQVKGDNTNRFSALSRDRKGVQILSWNIRGLGGLEKRKKYFSVGFPGPCFLLPSFCRGVGRIADFVRYLGGRSLVVNQLRACLMVPCKGEEASLSDEEVQKLHGITSDIHSLSCLNASICWQQSHSRWLHEGDANTKYFHSVLASHQRGNTISSLQVNGVTTKGVRSIREGVGGSGGWFGDCVSKKVGDGVDTFFWTDLWFGGRLFDLLVFQPSTVAEMSSLGWEVGGNAWVWLRQLWQWQSDPDRGYSVRGAYQLLASQQPIALDAAEEIIWHKQQTLITYRTISFSLLTLPAVFVLDDLFCSSSDLLVCGLFGLNEISASLETQSVPYLIFWTRSNSSLIGG